MVAAEEEGEVVGGADVGGGGEGKGMRRVDVCERDTRVTAVGESCVRLHTRA